MKRFLFFLFVTFIPMIFGWWLFLPTALLFVYLARLPYEIIFSGFVLDSIFYFGNGFFADNFLFLYSIFLILGALFLNTRVHWLKKI